MRSNKANIAGLTSPGQQSEMKSILAGTWPPLKPLPVFKYETVEYRATIDFDRKRGEWVCRKTSLPSNEVQELRGGLREITMALPHGEAETFIEGAEQQELDKDANRRLQALHDWRENYESGARYFELRDFLSESQRTELDDSLRLTLTARQLQFTPKNVANVFDDLAIAGGRFATLIDFAKRNKEKQGTDPQPQTEGVVPEAEAEPQPEAKAEPAIDQDQDSLGISSLEFGNVLNNDEPSNNDTLVQDQEAAEPCTGAEEFPPVSIKDVFPVQDPASPAERITHTPAQQSEVETSEIVDADSSSLADEFPAVSIKDVFPVQDPASLAERIARTPSQQFEIEASEILDADSSSLADEFPAVSIKDVFPQPDQAPLAEQIARTPAQQSEVETSEIADADSSSLDDELPAVSIKNVFPVQDPASLAERIARTPSQQFEIEASEILDADSPPLIEHPRREGKHPRPFTRFTAQVRTAHSSADRIEGSSSRFPRLEISAFQVGIVALLFLSAVIAFVVGLKAGRDALAGRLREPPKSILASDAKSPTLPDQAGESTSQTPTPPPPVANSNHAAGAQTQKEKKTLDDAKPPEEKSKESTPGANLAEVGPTVRPTDSDWPPTAESKPSIKPEVNSEHSGATGPMVRNVSPPPSSKLAHSPKAVRRINSAPRSPASYKLTSTMGAAPHLPRPSTILVTVPDRGSQPFRVSFPNKTIAATSSLAMTSQLSVLVFPEPGTTVAHESARLEAGEILSFVWPLYSTPSYPRPGGRYGLAETIRVRATIGQLGQVLEVKFLGGSASLLAATTRAIRQWRYRPTLLDKKPVQVQQDVTIEFRPPRYSSQASTHHPSHN